MRNHLEVDDKKSDTPSAILKIGEYVDNVYVGIDKGVGAVFEAHEMVTACRDDFNCIEEVNAYTRELLFEDDERDEYESRSRRRRHGRRRSRKRSSSRGRSSRDRSRSRGRRAASPRRASSPKRASSPRRARSASRGRSIPRTRSTSRGRSISPPKYEEGVIVPLGKKGENIERLQAMVKEVLPRRADVKKFAQDITEAAEGLRGHANDAAEVAKKIGGVTNDIIVQGNGAAKAFSCADNIEDDEPPTETVVELAVHEDAPKSSTSRGAWGIVPTRAAFSCAEIDTTTDGAKRENQEPSEPDSSPKGEDVEAEPQDDMGYDSKSVSANKSGASENCEETTSDLTKKPSSIDRVETTERQETKPRDGEEEKAEKTLEPSVTDNKEKDTPVTDNREKDTPDEKQGSHEVSNAIDTTKGTSGPEIHTEIEKFSEWLFTSNVFGLCNGAVSSVDMVADTEQAPGNGDSKEDPKNDEEQNLPNESNPSENAMGPIAREAQAEISKLSQWLLEGKIFDLYGASSSKGEDPAVDSAGVPKDNAVPVGGSGEHPEAKSSEKKEPELLAESKKIADKSLPLEQVPAKTVAPAAKPSKPEGPGDSKDTKSGSTPSKDPALSKAARQETEGNKARQPSSGVKGAAARNIGNSKNKKKTKVEVPKGEAKEETAPKKQGRWKKIWKKMKPKRRGGKSAPTTTNASLVDDTAEAGDITGVQVDETVEKCNPNDLHIEIDNETANVGGTLVEAARPAKAPIVKDDNDRNTKALGGTCDSSNTLAKYGRSIPEDGVEVDKHDFDRTADKTNQTVKEATKQNMKTNPTEKMVPPSSRDSSTAEKSEVPSCESNKGKLANKANRPGEIPEVTTKKTAETEALASAVSGSQSTVSDSLPLNPVEDTSAPTATTTKIVTKNSDSSLLATQKQDTESTNTSVPESDTQTSPSDPEACKSVSAGEEVGEPVDEGIKSSASNQSGIKSTASIQSGIKSTASIQSKKSEAKLLTPVTSDAESPIGSPADSSNTQDRPDLTKSAASGDEAPELASIGTQKIASVEKNKKENESAHTNETEAAPPITAETANPEQGTDEKITPVPDVPAPASNHDDSEKVGDKEAGNMEEENSLAASISHGEPTQVVETENKTEETSKKDSEINEAADDAGSEACNKTDTSTEHAPESMAEADKCNSAPGTEASEGRNESYWFCC